MTFSIQQYLVSEYENFNYVLVSDEKSQSVVIDASVGIGSILQKSKDQGITIERILLTHSHFDHTNGIEEVIALFPHVRIAVHQLGFASLAKYQDRIIVLAEGETILLGNDYLRVIHTPGHIPDAVCFYNDDCIFTGDTVFIGSHGRTDFPGGDAPELQKSFQRLRTLPDHLILYAGHNYNGDRSTLGEEKNNF